MTKETATMDDQASSREAGVTMVLTAIVLTALLGLSGLAIDGGRAYGERRQMQNAADSAALAGTRALDQFRRGDIADPLEIKATTETEAKANGADPDSITCELIDQSGQTVSPCPETIGQPVPASASGVRARVDNSAETFFIRVVGQESFTAAGRAAAQAQALRSGKSPFMLCASGPSPQGQDIPLLVESAPGVWEIDENQVGNDYVIWASGGGGGGQAGDPVKKCGSNGSQFKGLVDQDEEYDMPGVWDASNGVQAGPTIVELAGTEGCDEHDATDCVLAVPLCTEGPEDGTLYCHTFGSFLMLPNSGPGNANNFRVGRFLGGAVTGVGQGGGQPQLGEVRIIKLTE